MTQCHKFTDCQSLQYLFGYELYSHHRLKFIFQIKTRKLKDDEKKKALETERTKEEQLSKKRRREERREKYRVQDKMNKKSRRDT